MKAGVFRLLGAFLLGCMSLANFGCEGDGDGGGDENLQQIIRARFPLPEAAAYRSIQPSPLALIWQHDDGRETKVDYDVCYQKDMPVEWFADSVADLELVCFFGDEEHRVIQARDYQNLSNGDKVVLERSQYFRSFVLKEARSGNTIAETVLYGSTPRKFEYAERGDVFGDFVTVEQLQAWLAPYVEWQMR